MSITNNKEEPIDGKIMRVYTKVSDGFECKVLNRNGEVIGEYGGYVPDFFPEPKEHCGDYLILNINLETGQITNWKRPTEKDINELFEVKEISFD